MIETLERIKSIKYDEISKFDQYGYKNIYFSVCRLPTGKRSITFTVEPIDRLLSSLWILFPLKNYSVRGWPSLSYISCFARPSGQKLAINVWFGCGLGSGGKTSLQWCQWAFMVFCIKQKPGAVHITVDGTCINIRALYVSWLHYWL